MAHLTADEANLLALPLALGLITDTPPAPGIGDTIINTQINRRTGRVMRERVGTIARITSLGVGYTADGQHLGQINKGAWDTYVTKHAEPHSLTSDSTIIPGSAA